MQPTVEHRARDLVNGMPDLVLRAYELARQTGFGPHARRQNGQGDDFFQFRPFENGLDDPRKLDWRRSATGDELYVRQYEQKLPQSLYLHVANSGSMGQGAGSKRDASLVLALALALQVDASEERFAPIFGGLSLGRGAAHLRKVARILEEDTASVPSDIAPRSVVIYISDFFQDLETAQQVMARAHAVGAYGVLVQSLTPQEINFPYSGRVIFEGHESQTKFQTLEARALRDEYLLRLSQLQKTLSKMCQSAGWGYRVYDVGTDPKKMLASLNSLIGRSKR